MRLNLCCRTRQRRAVRANVTSPLKTKQQHSSVGTCGGILARFMKFQYRMPGNQPLPPYSMVLNWTEALGYVQWLFCRFFGFQVWKLLSDPSFGEVSRGAIWWQTPLFRAWTMNRYRRLRLLKWKRPFLQTASDWNTLDSPIQHLWLATLKYVAWQPEAFYVRPAVTGKWDGARKSKTVEC